MKVLFCCQFYAPSVGGVQELIRQLSERFVQRGHEVTVATTALPNREYSSLNGVQIKAFDVHGNLVTGMSGDLESYQDFVKTSDFDIMLVYAAQQWTFDALWTVLDDVSYPVVFAPCGFSCFYESGYTDYFRELSDQLNKIDYFIFNASEYRDIDFIQAHGEHRYAIISNAANEKEFNVAVDGTFRKQKGIPEQSFVFLTVGSLTGLKGHLEVVEAFEQLTIPDDEHATLILNGNIIQHQMGGTGGLVHKLIGVFRTYGFGQACGHLFRKILRLSDSIRKVADRVNAESHNKQVIMLDLDRNDLVQAFFSSNLFVFASKVEHSPLVLFESAAAGLPFLSVDVGNAREIAEWTGAGVICPSWKDKKGYTQVNTKVLSAQMDEWMHCPDQLERLGITGKRRWSERYTWEHVSREYEKVFLEILELST